MPSGKDTDKMSSRRPKKEDERTKLPMVRRSLKFRQGRPIGADREITLKHMSSFATTRRLRSYKDLHDLYKYSNLLADFPWTQVFRAGIVIIHRNEFPRVREVLMVYQKETVYRVGSELKLLPQRPGFPKGSRKDKPDDEGPAEVSALQTAVREVKEETGIDILDPRLRVQLSPTALIIPRPETNVEEVHIYFFATIHQRPQLTICNEELDGAEWVDMHGGLRGKKDATGPTQTVLRVLEDIDVWRPTTGWITLGPSSIRQEMS